MIAPVTEYTKKTQANELLHSAQPLARAISLVDGRHLVLLVTANLELQDRICEVLENDMRIATAHSILEAQQRLGQELPRLIISEMNDELEYFLLSMKDWGIKEIPVLLLNHESERNKAASYLDQGVSDLVGLPLEASELRTRAKNYIQSHLAKKILETDLQQIGRPLNQLAEAAILKSRELNRLNRLKDNFLAALSHELRNPINVISGFAEILMSDTSDKISTREAAQVIYRNAQFQVKLVQDLLDISRSIAGKLILDCRPMSLAELLQELLPSAQSAADKNKVKLTVHSQSEGWILADHTRISQVIWNLLTNALKFTPERGRIDIYLRNHESWVELTVQDTGVGIEPDFLPHIFEQFHQQDSSITRKFGGLGLGLAIVKHIVELHRGTVIACSDGVGHGASFTVQLPSLPN